MRRRDLPTYLLFLVLVVGGGLLIGSTTAPDAWYASLAKPPFNPPNWLFGPVWTVLYVAIAVAGARTWLHARGSRAMTAWWAQLVFNFLWSPVFFALHSIGGALVIVLAMAATVAAFIVFSWRSDRLSALLFIPYLAWVSFAALLNASIFWLN
ncbi:tryptophan-rich sensory protein [Aquibium carbonis]|uniref:Tryptophan-rich sensory protein n=1 Tax=Aquibium carbonis TaxID=2495581 RepID=A0A429YVD5_9HYPH|nr:TspO/MBR family protein [Aquibium carbonis]RST85306.1 tryptophan-rich sensory protein [Aquibium carbonis]